MGMEVFGKKGIVMAMLSLLIISIFIGTVYAAPAVDESTPIGMKWVKLGGAAVVGEPTSNVTTTPYILNGPAQYQKFENGVIVYSENWGAIIISSAIFDKWFTQVGRNDTYGYDIFEQIGVPIKDFTASATSQIEIFERGMIVVYPAAGTAFVVYGTIYERYWDVKSVVGLPTSEEFNVTGGRSQAFENGDIYFKRENGASEVHGAIRQRWLDLGGLGGSLGFPVSVEMPVLGAAIPGRMHRFDGGDIYYSEGIGAWEVTGEIHKAYEKYDGPAGWLGFPISGQGNTPTSGGVFNDFQNGVVVSHPSGDYKGTYAFKQLKLRVERIAGYGSDCILDICGSQDVYAYFKVNTPAGTIVDTRRPGSGDNGGDFSIDENWDIAQPVHSDLAVNVKVDAWDADSPDPDDHLGTVTMVYSIDNLWGKFEPTEHGAQDDGSFRVWFGTNNSFPYDDWDFPRSRYWSFHNFKTPELSPDQYAQTFADVNPEEKWWENPFNELFYPFYKGLAAGGNCFGMSLESVYADKDRSMYAEPIFEYFPDTQTGTNLTPVNDAHKNLINEINVKHGYQLGASAIDYFSAQFVSGNTHDPVKVFEESRAANESGDDPTISIFDSYLFGSGHNVRPYKWDNTTKPWRMYVADSNNPPGKQNYTPSYFEIDPDNNCFSYPFNSNYSGCGWTGGRMIYIPYHVLDETPRTPFWEVSALLKGVVFIVVGDTGQASQISDDAGNYFYEEFRYHSPIRWSQIRQVDESGIPNMAIIPLSDAGSGNQAEIYYGKAEGTTYHYQMQPRDGVTAGTPYEWLFNSGLLSTHLTIPGTPDVPDVITVRKIETPDNAVSLSIPAEGQAKEVAWMISGGVKGRWAKLTKLKMAPGQAIEVGLNKGGYDLEFQNSGPDTTAQLEVQADPGATPVTVGEISITNGITNFSFGAPLTTLTHSGGQVGGWLLPPINVTLQAFDYSGTGIDYIEYSFNHTAWIRYSGPFLYAKEGETTLYYRAKDRSGKPGGCQEPFFQDIVSK